MNAMRIRCFTTILACSALMAGCSILGTLSKLSPDTSASVVSDVRYGDLESQQLDVYLPGDPNAAELVMFIHGGAWSEGSRSQYEFLAQRLAAAGSVVFVPSFRLAPEHVFPSFVHDAALAVTKALEYSRTVLGKADPDLILAGHSSGAHVAALLVMDRQYLGADHRHIRSWIGISGAYRFTVDNSDKLNHIFGSWEPYVDTQPLLLAEQGAAAGSPPALLIHGTDDDRVQPRNSRRMADALGEAGVDVVLCEYEIGHATPLLSFSQRLKGLNEADDAVISYLDGGFDAIRQPACREVP